MVRIVGVINFKEFEMTMVAANTVMEKIEEVLNEFVAEDRIFSAFDVITLSYLFGFQIYFDFAGYSHIAIGCALTMGIKFRENFKME